MNQPKLVWDIPIRIFHWLLVAGIAGAWYTAEQGYEDTHMKIGYSMIGLLIFRLVWGFVGTNHARFCRFMPSPKALLSYIKNLFKPDSKQSVGHNPLGAISAIVMLLLIGLQAATGLFTKGEIWYGPYSTAISSELQRKLEGIHHINFNYILVFAGIHIFAVFFYLFYKKQNLILPMFSGKKKADVVPEGQEITNSKLWLFAVLVPLIAGLVCWLVFVAPPEVEYDYY